jgi:hypothetical protein
MYTLTCPALFRGLVTAEAVVKVKVLAVGVVATIHAPFTLRSEVKPTM